MKKKLIFFLTRYPYPPLGGDKKRVVSLINFYKKKYKVYLCIISFQKKIKKKKYEFHYKLNKIHQVYISISNFIKEKMPFQCSLYFNEEIYKKIERDLGGMKFELAIFHLIRSTPYFNSIKCKNNYLDATDSQVLNYNRLIKKYKKYYFMSNFFLKEKKLLKKFYIKINKKFNKIFYINRNDIEYDKTFITNKELISLNINESDLPFKNCYSKNSKNLLFLGRLTSIANITGVIDLILFFKKFQKCTKIKYNIYISGYSNLVFKIIFLFIKNKNFYYINSYEELIKKNIRFKYGLAYLAISSGFQNKVLDYQKLHLPVVASENVLEGLPKLLKKNCINVKNIKGLYNFFFKKNKKEYYFNKKHINQFLKYKKN